MRILLLFFMAICCNLCVGQQSASSLLGSWVKTKVTFSDHSELPENMEIKYSYARYTFESNGVLNVSLKFDSKGTALTYAVSNGLLTTSPGRAGPILNSYRIEENNDSLLVLLQSGRNGFEEKDCLRIYLASADKYASSFTATSDDIFSVRGADTVFIANERLFPVYTGKGDLFDVLKSGVPEQSSVDMGFLATYVVDENGLADSLHIIESISKEFDRVILKNFNKIRKNWRPAVYRGRPVSVLMTAEYRYFSSETMLPVLDLGQKGKDAVLEGDYGKALYFFDMAIKRYPENKEILYQRAVCRAWLGNNDAACADLRKLKELGSTVGAELQKKICR